MNKWTSDHIENLKGKIIVVTGANTGLGKATSRVLAEKGATVIMAVRSTSRGEQARKDILKEIPGSDLHIMTLDLSSLKSIETFASEFSSAYAKLDVLINNAGVMVPPYGKTEDGFELQFGTNHLGHFALTGKLLPLLKAAGKARIVTVSSGAHNWGNLNFDDLTWENREYKPGTAYGDSKLSNLYFTYKLADLLKNTDIKVTAAHPGWTATDLQKHSKLFMFLNPFFAQKPGMGCLPTLRAAFDPDAQSGDYFGPKGFMEMKGYPVKVSSNDLSRDTAVADRLWKVSEELTKVSYA
jgi:NAD(P)-dependent dehydrogenase (short-subunit alcohol dehydrogenase family)